MTNITGLANVNNCDEIYFIQLLQVTFSLGTKNNKTKSNGNVCARARVSERGKETPKVITRVEGLKNLERL